MYNTTGDRTGIEVLYELENTAYSPKRSSHQPIARYSFVSHIDTMGWRQHHFTKLLVFRLSEIFILFILSKSNNKWRP